MRKIITLGIGALLLSGCALPLPLQIGSWALDGISVLATQKSVSDHGISLVTQKDCAVWRGVLEGEICRNDAASDVMVADDAVKSPVASGLEKTASLKTSVVTPPVLTVRTNPEVSLTVLPQAQKPSAFAEKAAPDSGVIAETKSPDSEIQTVSTEPKKGIYFVLKSFRNPVNAQRLVSDNKKLLPDVLSARFDEVNVYRVVVGPVQRGHEKQLHRTLAREGFPDTWAIRIEPSNWQFARLPKPGSRASSEIAALRK